MTVFGDCIQNCEQDFTERLFAEQTISHADLQS